MRKQNYSWTGVDPWKENAYWPSQSPRPVPSSTIPARKSSSLPTPPQPPIRTRIPPEPSPPSTSSTARTSSLPSPAPSIARSRISSSSRRRTPANTQKINPQSVTTSNEQSRAEKSRAIRFFFCFRLLLWKNLISRPISSSGTTHWRETPPSGIRRIAGEISVRIMNWKELICWMGYGDEMEMEREKESLQRNWIEWERERSFYFLL